MKICRFQQESLNSLGEAKAKNKSIPKTTMLNQGAYFNASEGQHKLKQVRPFCFTSSNDLGGTMVEQGQQNNQTNR